MMKNLCIYAMSEVLPDTNKKMCFVHFQNFPSQYIFAGKLVTNS